MKQAGAWLGTVSRGGAGAQVSVKLGAGRPVFMLRGTSAAAKVEVRAGSHREVFAVARGSSGASRLITATEQIARGDGEPAGVEGNGRSRWRGCRRLEPREACGARWR